MSSSALKAVATGKPEEGKNPVVAFRGFLEKQKAQLAAALPRHMHADRMIRLACTEFAKNPMLQDCTPVSVFGSIIQASQLGLEIGVLGQAYLIPFKKNFKVGGEWKSQMECQFIPGYKGLIALARRSGEVTSIETNIVYDQDKFSLKLGIDSAIEHEPFLDGDRGAARLVYGVAKFKDGGHHLEWMTMSDVLKIRERSKAKDSGPWITDFEQMVRKTLIRRMANYLPMSVELEAALQVDAAVNDGKGATIDSDFIVVTEGEGVPQQAEAPAKPEAAAAAVPAGDTENPGAGVQEDAAAKKAEPAESITYAKIEAEIRAAETETDVLDAKRRVPLLKDEGQQADALAEVSKRLREIKKASK